MNTLLQSAGPFIELMRVSNPTGSCLMFFPYLIGSVSVIDESLLDSASWSYLAHTTFVFGIAAFMLHSAGCSWNDLIDAEIDRKVRRTKNRPIARRAISKRNACLFTLTETSVWLITLSHISWETVGWALPLIPAVVIYPYCKRFTSMPSVFLGVISAWGVFIGAFTTGQSAVITRISYDTRQLVGLFCHFLAFTIWMSIIDMIYAFQDLEDDLKQGVYSMAVTFRKRPKLVLGTMAVLQLALLGLAGHLLGQGAFYYVAVLIGGGTLNMWMLSDIQLQFPKECWWWFQSGSLVMQGFISMGLLGDILLRSWR